MVTTIIFIIVLAALIFVHELGHFLAAKAFGIRVDAFALGFGPKLISKKVGEVTYSLNAVPFGGYVKIFGENPDDDNTNGPDRARSFVHKPKYQQVAVLFAGIFFNILFAWFLVSLAFASGVLASAESYPEYKDRIQNSHIAITFVNPESPAEKAGLKPGDELLGFSNTEAVQKKINESGANGVEIKYRRDSQEKTATVMAQEGIVEGKYAIGISMDYVGKLQLPLHLSIIEGARFTWHIITETIVGFWHLLAGIFDGSSKLSSVTGPVGIAGLVGDAATLGFTYLLMFTAVISINLGILNAVPFPALDGGRIFFVIIEAIIRRPIKPIIANTVNTIGFVLLIGLMIVVTYRDIAKLFVK